MPETSELCDNDADTSIVKAALAAAKFDTAYSHERQQLG